MEVKLKERDGVTVASLSGKLAAGVGDRQLHDLLDELLAENRKRILLDLSGVTGIDSSGVGELVAAYTSIANRGGQLKLLNVTKKIQDLLQITQLLTVFETYDNEAEALASYRS